MTTTLTPPPEPSEGGSNAAALAEAYGLSQNTSRPPLLAYVRQLWQRRHFIWTFARSKASTKFSGARLGSVWQLLTPLLNAGVYYLIFGLILRTDRGVFNFMGYLVVGVFIFTFMQRTVTASARAIPANLSLIRALHFPRACLPLSIMLTEFQQLLISLTAMGAIVLLTGEPLTWAWLLVFPVVLLMVLFSAGLGMMIARVGAAMPDISQLLPFATRIWLYSSGVIFSIADRTKELPEWVGTVLAANPAAVYIDLARHAVMSTYPEPPAEAVIKAVKGSEATRDQYNAPMVYDIEQLWLLASGWAVLFLVVGFLIFWQSEEKYGRG